MTAKVIEFKRPEDTPLEAARKAKQIKAQRLKEQRKQDNESVLRSYRIRGNT